MKKYFRIIQGQKNCYADQAINGNFIAAGFIKDHNLAGHLPDNWRDFNKKFIPIFLEQNPEKTKIAAGLACGMLWTVAKGISQNDIVLCPDGKGHYHIGEVIGEYQYHKEFDLQHRREVRWFSKSIATEDLSRALLNSARSIGTVSNVTKHAEEIESLLAGNSPQILITNDETVEDPSIFALERHLEDFLVKNWFNTELSKDYDIYEEDGEIAGQQYPSDTGPIDILAVSKDKKELLVIELKRGRASDTVVGQIQRYMGYVKDELTEAGQSVRGIIIAFEDDIRIRRALSVAQNIDFYTYKITFKLQKQ